MIYANGLYRHIRKAATLIVIDMQHGFEASRDLATQAAVAREIRTHVRNGWPIIIVECRPERYGATHSSLIAALDGCPAAFVGRAYKKHNDGADVVIDACIAKHFDTDSLRVCGVNTTECVEETVISLSALLPRSCIEVVKDACNDWNENDFSRMLRCANVVLREGDTLRVA